MESFQNIIYVVMPAYNEEENIEKVIRQWYPVLVGKSEAYNSPNIMLTTYFKYYSEKTAFQTITFMPRQGGKNSINIWKIVKHGMKVLTDFKMFKKEMKN